MANLPPLPAVGGDYEIMLDVYTHVSARPPGSEAVSEEYGDTLRLQHLGRKAAQLAAVHQLVFSRHPSDDIPHACDLNLSRDRIMEWMDAYNMKRHVRCYPHDILNDPEEMSNIFYAYIGALYLRNGQAVVQNWISALIDPNNETPPLPNPSSPPPAPSSPPPQVSMQSTVPPVFQAQPPSQAPMQAPPSSLPPNLEQLVTLQVFNQTALQKGYNVSYTATSEGPPHQPTWTVTCLLNGNQASMAQGRSQKAAKEEAARSAFRNMQWP